MARNGLMVQLLWLDIWNRQQLQLKGMNEINWMIHILIRKKLRKKIEKNFFKKNWEKEIKKKKFKKTWMKFQNWINYLLDCKEEEVDLANCIRECVHHKPNHRHNDVVMVHQKRILNMWSSIRHCLDKYQKHIHIQATRLVLLWLKDNCLHLGSVINSPQLS